MHLPARNTAGISNSGILNFSGVSFNALSLSDTGTVFAIDNLDVSSSPSSAPEPSQIAGLAFAVLGSGGLLLRARSPRDGPKQIGPRLLPEQ